jgi:hypothetical protein
MITHLAVESWTPHSGDDEANQNHQRKYPSERL